MNKTFHKGEVWLMDKKLRDELRTIGKKAAKKRLFDMWDKRMINEIAAESVEDAMHPNDYVRILGSPVLIRERMEEAARIAIGRAYAKKKLLEIVDND